MTARKVTRCADCRDSDGWLLDPETLLPVRRCPCVKVVQTARQARDEAIGNAKLAKPQQLAAAYRIIEQEAETCRFVNADSVRERMDLAQIDTSIRAAAFRQAVAEGLLERDGAFPSKHKPTHGKDIAQYISRSFSRQLGVG